MPRGTGPFVVLMLWGLTPAPQGHDSFLSLKISSGRGKRVLGRLPWQLCSWPLPTVSLETGLGGGWVPRGPAIWKGIHLQVYEKYDQTVMLWRTRQHPPTLSRLSPISCPWMQRSRKFQSDSWWEVFPVLPPTSFQRRKGCLWSKRLVSAADQVLSPGHTTLLTLLLARVTRQTSCSPQDA